jgi:hypothetical protein
LPDGIEIALNSLAIRKGSYVYKKWSNKLECQKGVLVVKAL